MSEIQDLLLAALIALLVTAYTIPVIIRAAKWRKLYDHPNERKVHTVPIPSLGGMGIFIGFMLGLLFMADVTDAANTFQFYIAAFLVIFIFGIKDDMLIISPLKKFLGQLAVTMIIIVKADIHIDHMHGFLGILKIHPIASFFLTAFTVLVILNAFNLIDGIDGLAGSLGLVTSLAFGTFFLFMKDHFFALMAFTFASALAGFLIYNFSPAKIFMGDTGAMLIGAVNSILVIRFIETAEGSPFLPSLSSAAMGFGMLLIPLMDTLRVFAIRLFNGRSPFSPDRNHIHHILLDQGFSHTRITITLAFSQVAIIFITYLMLPIGTTWVIFGQILLFLLSVVLLSRYKKRPTAFTVIKGKDFKEAQSSFGLRRLASLGSSKATTVTEE